MAERALHGCLDFCGALDRPGEAIDDPHLIDFSQMETTIDQAAIEDVMEAMGPITRTRILHVGVGNSQLAIRFAPLVRVIDGVTVSEAEKALADELCLDNYCVRLVSKYSRDFPTALPHRYDFIIDNNLASYACCKFHFYRMMDTYAARLDDAGSILTDLRGMSWAVADEWELSFRDLQEIATLFSLRATRATGTVYELRHAADHLAQEALTGLLADIRATVERDSEVERGLKDASAENTELTNQVRDLQVAISRQTALLDEIHRQVTALSPTAGQVPPPPAGQPKPG